MLPLVRWRDADQRQKSYTVTVTQEFYMYAACVQDKFTYFDINVANFLKTKYSQKLYEICCMYTGKGTEDYRFYDPLENGMVYKKRVLKAFHRFLPVHLRA